MSNWVNNDNIHQCLLYIGIYSSWDFSLQVVKAMRGILNKLTPEKFDKLVDSVKVLPINTTERLSAVIDLIFEKVRSLLIN